MMNSEMCDIERASAKGEDSTVCLDITSCIRDVLKEITHTCTRWLSLRHSLLFARNRLRIKNENETVCGEYTVQGEDGVERELTVSNTV